MLRSLRYLFRTSKIVCWMVSRSSTTAMLSSSRYLEGSSYSFLLWSFSQSPFMMSYSPLSESVTILRILSFSGVFLESQKQTSSPVSNPSDCRSLVTVMTSDDPALMGFLTPATLSMGKRAGRQYK